MNDKGYDIAIIGGGVIGLTLARALLKEKARVVVYDAGAEIPPATPAAAGMLAPSFEHDAVSEALYEFGAESLRLWPAFAEELEEETGIDIDFRQDGVMGVALNEADALSLAEQLAVLSARGGDAKLLGGEDARRLEPALSREVGAALYAESDAQVDPRRLTAALRTSIEMLSLIHI